jgi:hypothetical protein
MRPRLLDLYCRAGGAAMDWTDDRRNLAEAIPPAYTEYIGAHLIHQLAAPTRPEPRP